MSLFDRPAKHTELRAYAGTVPGSPDAIFAALSSRLGTDHGDADHGHVAADPMTRRIVQQGDWRYRGEYRVLPDSAGSRIEDKIVNVAAHAHWLGRITGRDVLKASPAAFEQLLDELAREPGD